MHDPASLAAPPAEAPYAFRPAEFRPAVFMPAAPPPGAHESALRTSADPFARTADAVFGPDSESPFASLEHTADLDVTPTSDAATLPPLTTPPQVAAAPEAPRVSASHTLTRIGEELFAWFKTLLSAAVYATLIVTFGFQVARVEGQSMAPTLEDQDRLIVNKLAYQLHDPRVGDIVMLLYPDDPDKSFVKRVIGEPYDTIRSVDGRIYRNDVPLPDEFIPEEFRDHLTWGPEVVPQARYFVMGDHRNNSSDSRTWGFVPKKYIIGKVQLRWWPLDQARIFDAWK